MSGGSDFRCAWMGDDMSMLIDCDTCAVRDLACGDCVVTALLGPQGGHLELDSSEQNALDALAGGGLLPPLRLIPTSPPDGPESGPRCATA